MQPQSDLGRAITAANGIMNGLKVSNNMVSFRSADVPTVNGKGT
jgi:hypothetical protein